MVKKFNPILLLAFFACGFTACTYDFGGMLAAGSSVGERFSHSTSGSGLNFYPHFIEQDKDSYEFLIATDLHIQDDQWGQVGRFLATASEKRYLMTMLLGDYMYIAGSPLTRLADSIAAHQGLRVFPAIGNHDVYKDGYQDSYRCKFGPTCYYFRVNTARFSDLFIILDSANGTLGPDQLSWLRALLSAERGSSRHCFIFTHANFFSPSSYMDVISTYPLEEQMKLLDVFASQHVTAVFSGHSHAHDETTVRGVKYVTLNAWREGRKGGEYCRVICHANGNTELDFKKMP